jgi:flagellar biosynthetic protein FlhB
MLLVGGSCVWLFSGPVVTSLDRILVATLTFERAAAFDPAVLFDMLNAHILDVAISMIPLAFLMTLAAMAAPLMLGGWLFNASSLAPKFSKLNPLPGIKRMFSVNAATEALKAILKSVLIGGIATWFIWRERADIIGLISMPLPAGIAKMIDMITTTFFVVTSAMILLVAIDVPFQLWSYHKKLRMTKEEIKQEYKEAEGSPEVKGRIRQMQREAARKRMMQEIPSANVIVTNPTHYAVAIKYDDGMRAPQVVAKGSLKLAEKIIDTGKEHRVIVMRSPSFARALYFHAELGDDIPAKLYAAAAQVLAYVFQLKSYQDNGGLPPVFPDQLDVPAELDPQSKRQQDATPP